MTASSLAESLPRAAALDQETAEARRWSLATRIAFRFVFCFLVLFNFPFPLNVVPFIDSAWYEVGTEMIGVVAKAFFGITTLDATFTGSGDKLYHWIQLLTFVVLSLIATVVWSIANRKAVSYPRLHAWFIVYLRFALAVAMIGYGASKVIPSQFPPPALDRLLQPIGRSSPMGLLWTFMGASAPYTIFAGLGELIGGLLLTLRRTALLGALISAGVMLHVVVLNFSYDVPVKIYSSVLFFTALVIAAPDAKRLADFFVLKAKPERSLMARKALWTTARVLAMLFVIFTVFTSMKQSWQRRQMYLARGSASPLEGVWNVDELTIDGVGHPPLTTDTERWRRFVIAGESASIQIMDDSRTRFGLTLDAKAQTLVLKKRADRRFLATFHYSRPDPKTLALDGTFEGKKIAATLHRADMDAFLLRSRGFHWVNEVPFNR